jgi:cytochrome c oxidase cbb3-type subunit 4
VDYGLVHIIWTALLLICFIGIVVWAWSGRQKRRFEAAARAVLEDDGPHPHSLSRVAGEGGEPSALRATSFTREERRHG